MAYLLEIGRLVFRFPPSEPREDAPDFTCIRLAGDEESERVLIVSVEGGVGRPWIITTHQPINRVGWIKLPVVEASVCETVQLRYRIPRRDLVVVQ